MIQEHELRIGNLVLIPYNKSNKKEGFYQARIEKIGEFGSYIKPEDYEPILLTEELLLKFGFEKEPCPHNETMYYWIPNILSLEKSIEHDSSIVFSHDWGEVEIKYVHQLQNLYWVLFGEELTIKK